MFTLLNEFTVRRESDGTFIPLQEGSTGYSEYLEWVAKGNTPAPYQPDLPAITQFSVREYIQRFTQDEQIAIRRAQFTDMQVGLVYDDFNRANFIDVTDPDVAAGVDLYIAKGLLEPARRAELLRSGT